MDLVLQLLAVPSALRTFPEGHFWSSPTIIPTLKTLVFRCFMAKEVSLTASFPCHPDLLLHRFFLGTCLYPACLASGQRGVFSELSFVVSTESKREAGEL